MFRIIGGGLIGGAIAKKLEEKHQDFFIFDSSQTTLKQMKNELKHVIVFDSLDSLLNKEVERNDFDIIVLANPLRLMKRIIEKINTIYKWNNNSIIVDVGSTKRLTVRTIDDLKINQYYCGMHPMAGDHKSGFENSKAQLLDGATWALTPSYEFPKEKILCLQKHVKETFDGHFVNINSAVHDDTTALISHLPHIFATEIANLVENYENRELALDLAAGSYKDAVRVAATDPRKTEAMVLENSKPLSKYLKIVANDFMRISDELEKIDDSKELLEEDNKNAPKLIKEFFDTPKKVRKWRNSL